MPFDAEAARLYSISDDRDEAPFFAGRDEEIWRFRDALAITDRKESATVFRIYQGAPHGASSNRLSACTQQRGRVDRTYAPPRAPRTAA